MTPQLKAPEGLLWVRGFRANGVAAGIKKNRPDVALIESKVPSSAAAVFTQNPFAAAPVHLSRQHVADGDIRAIVCNSGNANACTGRQGLRDALAMAQETAGALGIGPEQVLVCSTGIIGRRLPREKVLGGIRTCAERLDEATGHEVANAILTTDSGPKEAQRAFVSGGAAHKIAGIAKGAGMIHPNMATMLAFLVTDANVAPRHLRAALQDAVDGSFNQISVDGDESTNDTAAILANGAAGGPQLEPGAEGWQEFMQAMRATCQNLAKQIAADGEGATKLIHVHAKGASSDARARKIARAVAASNLVKSAVHGEDPNWGRIIAAMGQADPSIDPSTVAVAFGTDAQACVLRDGAPLAEATLAEAHKHLVGPEIHIHVRAGNGPGRATAWGCDLTPDYVTFNAQYTT